jgi:hypothetical protein
VGIGACLLPYITIAAMLFVVAIYENDRMAGGMMDTIVRGERRWAGAMILQSYPHNNIDTITQAAVRHTGLSLVRHFSSHNFNNFTLVTAV